MTTTSTRKDTNVVTPIASHRSADRASQSSVPLSAEPLARSMILHLSLLGGVVAVILWLFLRDDGWATTWGIGPVGSMVIASIFSLVMFWVFLRVTFPQHEPLSRERALRAPPTGPEHYLQHGLGPCSPKASSQDLYVDLLKRTVTNLIYEDPPWFVLDDTGGPSRAHGFNLTKRVLGEDGPSSAHTMVGIERLNNLQTLFEDVMERGVPGDLLEAGVYRGGAAIFLSGLLRAHDVRDRRLFVCDTFRAVAPPRNHWLLVPLLQALASIPSKKWQRRLFCWMERHSAANRAFPINQNPSDSLIDFTMWFVRNPKAIPDSMGTGRDQVVSHFARYGLLNEQVVFLQGFFAETLPTAPIEKLALMRLDGDTYESTMDALNCLYAKLSVGGYCIIDDYACFSDCQRAVDEFRARHGIDDEIVPIDNLAVYWSKSSELDAGRVAQTVDGSARI